MTSRQIELVQNSFQSVRPILEKTTLTFYDRLFELDPSVRKLFHTARQEQARKLADMLVVVVDGLNHPEEIVPRVEELGRRHAGYGVRPQHYATVGEAFLWALRDALGTAFTREVEDAWNCAYTFLATAMQSVSTAPG